MKTCSFKPPLIAILDSGVGGLNFYKAVKHRYPQVSCIYLADDLRMPYGEKSDREIIEFASNCALYLDSLEVDIIVIACNTISAYALRQIKKIVKTKVIGVIDSTLEEAISVSQNQRFALLATTATINSNYYQSAIKTELPSAFCLSIKAPKLVEMAENSQVNANTFSQQLSKYMQEIVSHDVDTLILGCTHFSCFKETIALKSSLNLVDSSQCCLKELNLQMPTVNCKAVQEDRFLVTKDANSFLQKLKFQQIEARFVETVKF